MKARLITRRLTGLVTVVLVAGAAMLAVASAARAVDTDGNGYHDFLIRDYPYLPYGNVGAMCQYFYSNGVYTERITVRPPRVWSLWNLSNQSVRWRARFVYAGTNATVQNGAGAWGYGIASPNQYTDFGGGRNVPDIDFRTSEYWQAGEYYQAPANLAREQALVDVQWYNPWTGGYTTSNTLAVDYYYTNGSIQPANVDC